MRAAASRRWAVAMVLGAALGLTGCSSAGTSGGLPASALPALSPAPDTAVPAPQATGALHPHWLIVASAVRDIESVAGTAFATRHLDGPQTTVVSDTAALPRYVASWNVTFAFDAKSLAQIRAGLAAGLSPGISMILYDPEDWPYTPVAEQRAVGAAAATAASLAAAAGRKLIVSPGSDLAKVVAPGKPLSQGFLGAGILAQVAPSAAWVDIQAQRLEADPARYAAFVRQAVVQIHAANPRAVIYAGLSSSPSGQHVTVAQLLSDVSQTAREVTGYWLNISGQTATCPRCGSTRPQPIVSLLTDVGV